MSRPAGDDRRTIVRLFWLYFALLIVEGALRKWVLPGWSDALLIVRDPVAAVILLKAMSSGFLPLDKPMRLFVNLAVALALISALQVALGIMSSLPVVAFGLRTYVLHPPLIFVMMRVLDHRDLRRLMMAIIVLAVPIALLMVEQFRSSPLDWINAGAGEGRFQIFSALGRIRPAGPFSFISGPILYFALTIACLIGAQVSQYRIPFVAQVAGWAALVVAASVSGSRSLVVALVPVLVGMAAALFARPELAGRTLRVSVTAGAVGMVLWSGTVVVQEGLEVFSARVAAAGPGEIVDRSIASYDGAIWAWTEAPLFGAGIGLGTNAGSALLGTAEFRFGEGEWSRTVLEAGPVVGLAYLAWRALLSGQLLVASWRAARAGFVLPLLLLGSCLTNLLLGPWGQPTTQGFAVLAAGLCAASCRQAMLAAFAARQPHGAAASVPTMANMATAPGSARSW